MITGVIAVAWQILQAWLQSRTKLVIRTVVTPVYDGPTATEIVLYVTNMGVHPVAVIAHGFLAPICRFAYVNANLPMVVRPGECVTMVFPVRDYHYQWYLLETTHAVLPSRMSDKLTRQLPYTIWIMDSIGRIYYLDTGLQARLWRCKRSWQCQWGRRHLDSNIVKQEASE